MDDREWHDRRRKDETRSGDNGGLPLDGGGLAPPEPSTERVPMQQSRPLPASPSPALDEIAAVLERHREALEGLTLTARFDEEGRTEVTAWQPQPPAD